MLDETIATTGKSAVVVAAVPRKLKFKTPAAGSSFLLTEEAEYPDLEAEVEAEGFDGTPELEWSVAVQYTCADQGHPTKKPPTFKPVKFERKAASLKWKPFIDEKDAKQAPIAGGEATLTVKTSVEGKTYEDSVKFTIKGTNPTQTALKDYVKEHFKSEYSLDDATIANITVTIVYHESYPRWCNFEKSGDPIVSKDYGFGVMQLTKPVPEVQEIWSWKKHLEKAIKKYVKPAYDGAIKLLSDHKPFKYEHVAKEIWCQYNSGKAYHKWDSKAEKWVCAQDDLVCESKSNVGWISTKKATIGDKEISNSGASGEALSAAELKKRDADEIKAYGGDKFNKGLWGFYGWCYADCSHASEYETATGETFPDKEFTT